MKTHKYQEQLKSENEFDQLLEKIRDVYGLTKHSQAIDKESLQKVIKTIAMIKVNKVKL